MKTKNLFLIAFICLLAYVNAEAQTYYLSKSMLACRGTNQRIFRTARKAKISNVTGTSLYLKIKSMSCTQEGKLILMPSISHPDAKGFYIDEKKKKGIVLTKDGKMALFAAKQDEVFITNAGATSKKARKKALDELKDKFNSLLTINAIEQGFAAAKQNQIAKMMAKVPKKSTSDMAATWSNGEYTSQSKKTSFKFNKYAAGVVSRINASYKAYDLQTTKNATTNYIYRAPGGWCLVVLDDFIYRYQGSLSYGGDVYTKNGQKMKPDEAKNLVEAYMSWAKAKIKEEQEAHAAAIVAAKKAKEDAWAKERAARKAKYGLQDKDVVKIEFIKVKTPQGHYDKIKYHLRATLRNGTKIATNQKGYHSDYIVSFRNGKVKSGQLRPGFVRGDKIILTAKCKYKPSITTTKSVVIPYTSDVFITYNGKAGWSSYTPGRGRDFIVYAKAVRHAVTGKKLIKIRVKNLDERTTADYKIGANRRLKITAIGGAGGKSGRRPGRRGGNIILIKDPNLRNSLFFSYENRGGAGSPGYNRGPSGRFQEKIQPVSF